MCNGIPVATMLPLVLATKQFDCGMYSGECIRIFIGHRSTILLLAMSPDGRYMASGDEDGTVMMWELSSGHCVTPLIGHTSCVWTLAFSCEGSLFASGSADCTVKLWDLTTCTEMPRTEEKQEWKSKQIEVVEDSANLLIPRLFFTILLKEFTFRCRGSHKKFIDHPLY